MPYYSWVGINNNGTIIRGHDCAHTTTDLEQLLLEKQIGLMQARAIKKNPFTKKISNEQLAHFFNQLSIMIGSGVHLTHALDILTRQISHPELKQVAYNLRIHIEDGLSLHTAMGKNPKVFNNPMIHMIQAGQEAGTLSQAMEYLATYITTKASLNKQLRSAALMPAITFIVFILIALSILLFIVPTFESMFKVAGHAVPQMTQHLFNLSHALQSGSAFTFIIGALLFFLALQLFHKTSYGKQTIDKFLIHIPGIKQIIITRELLNFFQTMTLMVTADVPIVTALHIAHLTIRNSFLRNQFALIEPTISTGKGIAQTLSENTYYTFEPTVIAMIAVGEESSKLGLMLSKIADWYRNRLEQQIHIITKLFQPVLLIVLGLLIATLIFLVYIPIFSLANVITF